jgi:hypothetical protein
MTCQVATEVSETDSDDGDYIGVSSYITIFFIEIKKNYVGSMLKSCHLDTG